MSSKLSRCGVNTKRRDQRLAMFLMSSFRSRKCTETSSQVRHSVERMSRLLESEFPGVTVSRMKDASKMARMGRSRAAGA